MGSWNGTCALSQLPIEWQDDILLFLLQPMKQISGIRGGFSGVTDLYQPVGLPIAGKYNDYGGIEHITSNEDIMWQFVTKKGRYAYQLADDCTVTPQSLEEFINDVIQTGDCKNYDFMIVRRDIFEHLKKQNVAEPIDYAREFDAFKVEYQKTMAKLEEEYGENAYGLASFADMEVHEALDYNNVYSEILDRHHFFSLRTFVRDAIHDESLAPSIADVLYTNDLLKALRKSWTPQNGAGSQASDFDAHLALGNAVKDVAEIRNQRLAED